jgi:hypothetical protein
MVTVLLVPLTAPAAEVPVWLERAAEGFIAFPDVTLRGRFNANDDFDANPALDLFYARDFGRFRFLVEGFLDRHEQELERLQLGWMLTPDATLWGGRFHTPIGYWNTEYHHGAYLQTSISRPGIVEFEDNGGILPLHVSGAMIQGLSRLGGSEVILEVSIGAGPQLDDDGLEPFDFFDPGAHTLDVASAARVAWRPDPVTGNEFGAFFSAAKIPGAPSNGVDDVRLVVGGAYGLVNYRMLRFLGSGFAVSDRVEPNGGGSTSNVFPAGYFQTDFVATDSLRLYGRVELTGNTRNDPYLAFTPDFQRHAFLGGVRYDITPRQAIKLEFADRETMSQSFQEIVVQWSAAFP